ncbi:MAG: hypothetical protein CM15mP32_2830 [Flavobacteriaceae bacterium]|nr:MAG: hypothetical protein CM15mP32_2830 [Flavobacteriaceae bacterium]
MSVNKQETEKNKLNYKKARFKIIMIEVLIIVFLLVLVHFNI